MKLIILLCFLTQLTKASSLGEVQKIIELRQNVETVSQELDQQNQRQNAEIEMLVQRKNELELNFSRDRLKLQVLKNKSEWNQNHKISGLKTSKSDAVFIKKWILGLQNWVQRSLPINQESRLEQILEFEKRLQAEEPVEVLIWDIWSFIDGEIKMTKSNQYELMNLPLADPTLAEVARIGMLQVYFKTPDKQYGYAVKNDKKWTYQITNQEIEKAAIQKILNAVKEKKSRTRLDFPGLVVQGNL